ncbi:hypothetical protein A2643_00555 [Candidatus Nomurabacteria bacterium RIFCSPHIGHO2_01_FULL_39_220]|uniref:General secretion pathway GspH domain-containing protein n=1 Tax=Candidatus Nomurabacteria bacterium RIFCSPLOWO2_02_FULL_40_67 TaxID=1801787 RepID=A0A1F6Y4A6_9BACT|nr:MAG: fimbrial pilin related signal peptide protein [Parcubacteria group bacterium GW2011_GWA2_40_37]KKS10595.1 MAG: fimbrial pilin related signal peptide protein [Parcubacteria group bacterium GW2011_GWB1_41_5]OGI62048.1 MAG: hypothetical protein A2W12_01690 [Candidatus Nomurabacteria bacterium RBG_16_40_11]OGI70263.1 MAG: hypothetical protein A2643_00555 [Candidatus Nomurabacteria bacterium RIFCSPHIGHO2_01_FULL_39_220]OGI73466.1 MAG: hypothetical protein A2W56_02155 [Candidatus Nomurabacter
MKNFYQRGIGIIEILIVIAVLGLLVAIVVPQFSKMRENQALKNAVGEVLSSIDKARSQTLSSLNSFSYGVRFESDKVIIFKSTAFNPNATDNETINIVAPASISTIALSGGGSDIYFNRLSGIPSKTGNITISTPNYFKVINISATGIASVN